MPAKTESGVAGFGEMSETRGSVTENDFDALIGEIYEAVLDRSLWPRVLARLSEALGVAGSVLGVHDLSGGSPQLISAGLDAEHIDHLREYLLRPGVDTMLTPRIPLGEPITSEEFFYPTPWTQTEPYQLFSRPLGFLHGAQLMLLRNQCLVAWFAVHKSFRGGSFSKEELAWLRRLVPHLQRALRINRVLDTSKARLDGLDALLDGLATAALLLDGDARPLYANAAADTLLAQRDGFDLLAGRLTASYPEAHAALARALNEAAQGYRNPGTAPVAVAISRPSGQRPYTILAVPFPRESEQAVWPGVSPAVLLFIADPEATPRPPLGWLRMLYGLTPMESRLALCLADGRELGAAAEALGISLNTAKTHVKEVFGKTGARRQAELVRLLTSTLGGLAADGIVRPK